MKLQSNGLPEGMIIVEPPNGVISQEHLDAIQRQHREASESIFKDITPSEFTDSPTPEFMEKYEQYVERTRKEETETHKVEAIKADRDWAILDGSWGNSPVWDAMGRELSGEVKERIDQSISDFNLSKFVPQAQVSGTFLTPDDEYLMVADDILHRGREKGDRTGTGTISLFGTQMRFDLSEGFPLLTTKKIHWKSVVHELLWFISGDTNIKYLKDNGVRIWDEWIRPYSLDRNVVFVHPRVAESSPYTGGFSTKGLNLPEGEDRKLVELWVKMMRRCYDPNHHRYELYGALGATVHSDWHDPSVFLREVKNIPHWDYKRRDWNNFELDKDYYGSSQYGLETSVWLRTDENNLYMKSAKNVKVLDSNGDEFTFLTQGEAARRLMIPTSSISRFMDVGKLTALKGKNKTYIGWEFETLELENTLMRLELIPNGDLGPIYGKQWRNFEGIDQLSWVINEIKNNPDSRRLVVTAWNPSEIPSMALPPCHMFFQLYVEPLRQGESRRRLSCQLYQRSCDIFLGVPFNIASYALLTHLIAHVTDLDVGEFIWTGGDSHIYLDHVDQINEQLQREVRDTPVLFLNPAVRNIDDFTFDDIEILNYKPHPAIKAKVSV